MNIFLTPILSCLLVLAAAMPGNSEVLKFDDGSQVSFSVPIGSFVQVIEGEKIVEFSEEVPANVKKIMAVGGQEDDPGLIVYWLQDKSYPKVSSIEYLDSEIVNLFAQLTSVNALYDKAAIIDEIMKTSQASRGCEKKATFRKILAEGESTWMLISGKIINDKLIFSMGNFAAAADEKQLADFMCSISEVVPAANAKSALATTGNGLDGLLAIVEQREEGEKCSEEMRRQQEAAARRKQDAAARKMKPALESRRQQVLADLAKYERIVSSRVGQDLRGSAWEALLFAYPEGRGVPAGDAEGLLDALGLGSRDKTIDTATGMEFVLVKGGCFQMGDAFNLGEQNEKPVHEVCVDDFYLGKYEVTQGEWLKIMGSNPAGFQEGDDYPVESVSWDAVQEYLDKLNRKTGRNYRLPTEAEWEYAARSGGMVEKFSGFSSDADLPLYANLCDARCSEPARLASQDDGYKETSPTGTYLPNGLGLYDMTGNVAEWCADFYFGDYYENSPRDNPTGPENATHRVARGGSWGLGRFEVRTTSRYALKRAEANPELGFRLALPAR